MSNYPAFATSMGGLRNCALVLVSLIGACLPAGAQTTPAGATVRNSGTVVYQVGAQPRRIVSNEVTLIVEPSPTRATIQLARYAVDSSQATTVGPTACRSAGGYVPLAPPVVPTAGALDPLQPVPLSVAPVAHAGEPVFVRIEDADQNRDASQIETLDVRIGAGSTDDAELLRLSETGPDTGVFVGYIPTAVAAGVAGDCVLNVARDAELTASYVDARDPTDRAESSALIDPFGFVFDSQSGAAINGARVRLLAVTTGAPAIVFGDDGVSRYPSEMITGQRVTDAGGTLYDLPAGVFRFPLVAPGNYRLEVIPPDGYAFPSTTATDDLQRLPGAPFRLGDGSFGRDFAAAAPPAVAVDVPLDPGGTALLLRKSANVATAAVGDFLQYTLTIENTSERGLFQRVDVRDVLPVGARYRRGSLRIDDEVAADPEIAADGRTLTIRTAALAARRQRVVRYVVELTVAARGREAVNVARAEAPGGVVSNEARSLVRLTNELFSEQGFIVGRAFEGGCDAAGTGPPGVAGVRVYLEDGRYAVSDEDGKFHFEGVPAGSHVVQVDLDTVPAHLELQDCGLTGRFAGRRYSQFVDLRAGALWRADFALRERAPPTGEVEFDFRSHITGPTRAAHLAKLRVQGVTAGNSRVLVMLPDGLEYVAGSAHVDGKRVADGTQQVDAPLNQPVSVANGLLTFRLRELAPGVERHIEFETRVLPGSGGELPVKAVASWDTAAQSGQRTAPLVSELRRGVVRRTSQRYSFTPRFDVAEATLQATDKDALARLADTWQGIQNIRIQAVGHTDSTPIAPRARLLYADNYELSAARASAVANYLAGALRVPTSRIAVRGAGPDEPLAVGRDPVSLAQNRRVELVLEGERVDGDPTFELRANADAPVRVATSGLIVRGPRAALATRRVSKPAPAAAIESEASPTIDTLAPGIAWLAPAEGALAPIASLKIAIQHGPGDTVELTVNDAPVSRLNFDGTSANQARTVAVSRWRGVDIADGDNRLEAVVSDVDGREIARLQRVVHYGGGPVRAVVAKEQSVLVADGKTRPVIALRMFDAYGKPARRGTLAAFQVDAPYRSWWEVEALDDNKILSLGNREPIAEVGDDGIALVELEPTTQTGNVTLRLRFNDRQRDELRVWLVPGEREFVLVGIAEGTAAYRTIAGNAAAAAADERDAGITEGGRVAFFAKGQIKGDYLLTLAYDSARDRQAARARLRGVIEPDRYYLLYGDGAEQRFEAASQRKLYVKLERRQFVALFGDYDTGFTVTELSRYNRTLNGFKSDYAGERFGVSAFAARTDTGFVRDEIPGDGTSGLYRLSRNPIVIGSDKLRLEVRDRFQSNVVLETRELAPFIDYDLDYDRGTVFFKAPVASRDRDLNPVFIIADYEVRNGGDEEISAGVRVTTRFADDRLELGASLIHEGAAAGDTQVGGADLKWRVAPATEIRAEVASSRSDDPARPGDALAYLAEVRHVTDRLDARAYVREEEEGFGIGQQFSAGSGTRKTGIDGRWKLREHWLAQAEVQQQTVMSTAAKRLLASTELQYQATGGSAGVGVRHVADDVPGQAPRESEQAFLSGSIEFFDQRVTLRAASDFTLAQDDASPDYPARSLLGIDYKLTPASTLFAEYEHADGRDLAADTTRVGLRTRPWERTQIVSTINQSATEFGPRTFANFGLTQGWQLNERWAFDVGIDQSNTLRGADFAPLNPAAPLASGTLTEDYFASFLGAQYRSELWQFTTRVEHRSADTEDRWSVTTGWYREPRAGHALSLALQAFDTATATAGTTQATARFAWAFRPIDSDWIVFDRLELQFDSRDDLTGNYESRRLINNLHANWQWNPVTQLGLQYGARFVTSTFGDERYNGYSDLVGIDWRRQLSRRYDIGLHGAALQSWSADLRRYSAGLDVGVNFAKNVWISLGYNVTGFDDADFAASRYTDQGPYIKFRIKADQDTFRDLRLDSLRPAR
ncbi:MAG: OmpA family protein [Steroidobacteraceae bacterium]